MSLRDITTRHYRDRLALARALRAEGLRLWRLIRPGDISTSWRLMLPRMVAVMELAQKAAAGQADQYLNVSLSVQDIDPAAAGVVVAESLSGVSSQGEPLPGLLDQPRIATMTALSQGAPVEQALTTGWNSLEMILATQVADAGRVADMVGLTSRRRVGGYVRQVVGRTCGRCVILAGKFFRYNTGFQRHPRCDCIHIPTRENLAGDLTTDPRAWFDSLSRAEQNRQFTKAGAESIRLGADMSRVVNARKGAFGLSPASGRLTAAEKKSLRGGADRGRLQTQRVFGRDLYLTTEATTKRGITRKVRLMPESILSEARDRDDAISLLKVHGYLR